MTVSYSMVVARTRGKAKPVKIQEAQRPKLNNALKVIGPRSGVGVCLAKTNGSYERWGGSKSALCLHARPNTPAPVPRPPPYVSCDAKLAAYIILLTKLQDFPLPLNLIPFYLLTLVFFQNFCHGTPRPPKIFFQFFGSCIMF